MSSLAGIETVLVTGATGFVGSHVLEAAANFGLQLRALVRKPVDAARLEYRARPLDILVHVPNPGDGGPADDAGPPSADGGPAPLPEQGLFS